MIEDPEAVEMIRQSVGDDRLDDALIAIGEAKRWYFFDRDLEDRFSRQGRQKIRKQIQRETAALEVLRGHPDAIDPEKIRSHHDWLNVQMDKYDGRRKRPLVTFVDRVLLEYCIFMGFSGSQLTFSGKAYEPREALLFLMGATRAIGEPLGQEAALDHAIRFRDEERRLDGLSLEETIERILTGD